MKTKWIATLLIVFVSACMLMGNTIFIPIVRTAPASDEWVVTKNLGMQFVPGVGTRQILEMSNAGQGHVVKAYCIDVGKPVPTVGKTCSFDGSVFHCGSANQRFKIWEDIVTPTPTYTPLPWTATPSPTPTATATPTNTPTPTATNTPVWTPTNTPTPCTFTCPAMKQVAKYPTMNLEVFFQEYPNWGTTSGRISVVYPNEITVSTSWPIPWQSLDATIRCENGYVNGVEKCDDGSCFVGCSDMNYSQETCQFETVAIYYACNAWVTCQAYWELIDPWAEEASLDG